MATEAACYLERRKDYVLALDSRAPNWVATTEHGAWALRLCRSGLTTDEVSYRFAKRTQVSLRRALELVEPFADEAGDLAKPNGASHYRGRAHYLRPDKLKELWLHVTDQCNLACRHCLVSSSPAGAEGLDTETLCGIIRQARDLGVETFYFTGGEPLLRSDIVDLLRLVTVEFGATAVLLTNGVLLAGEALTRLQALPRERLFLQISLDGSCPERNDALRSRGSFEGAVRGLRAARAAGLHVTVATVALRRNLDDLIPVASLIRELGVTHLHLMWQHVRERGGKLPRASVTALRATARELWSHARSIGLTVDNFENTRRMVNGDPGVKYDLTNACWDSLAIYRDGRIFPSACLVGLESQAAGSALRQPLREVWLESERLAAWRARSVIEHANGDPWLFLHGGGDPEQAFFASNGGCARAEDPYLPLHRELARLVIDETVAERQRLLGGQPAGLVIYHAMGDDGYGCPRESGAANGGEHTVDFVHSNCVLIQDVIAKSRAQVRAYYAEAARTPKTEICQPVAIDPRLLAHIPDDVMARSYGCGSPVFAAALAAGETVVDLGSGAGLEAFLAAKLVGPAGRVIGVDMTPDMLAFSNRSAALVAERLGYRNVFFTHALLEGLPLASDSADAVISNCVINLSPEKLRVFSEIRRVLKPGGRVVISDLVSQRALPPEIRFNPRLKGECIAGAMTDRKLLATLAKLGFTQLEVLAKNPWREVDGIQFDTMTVRGFRPSPADAVQQAARPGLLVGTLATRPVSAAAAPHLVDCMVCGSPLMYLEAEEKQSCHYCGQVRPANARCAEGHFVCDTCHARDHLSFIKTFCRHSTESDPIALFSEMRRSHLFPLHGPEHHALVPAAFLTAYRNQFSEPPEPRVIAAIDRGAALPGGTCAYWGGCAAALGIGIAYAAILRATPLSEAPRGIVQTVVSRVLALLGDYRTPRCCRRESYLALAAGGRMSAEFLPHALACGPAPTCDQMARNHECMGEACPFHPGA